jgi:hypothetical protein
MNKYNSKRILGLHVCATSASPTANLTSPKSLTFRSLPGQPRPNFEVATDSMESYFFADVASDVARHSVESYFLLTWNVTQWNYIFANVAPIRGM